MYGIHEYTGELLDRLVDDFIHGEGSRAPWKVVPASTIVAVWTSSARYGFVRNERGLDRIEDQFYRNIVQLYINTVVAEHDTMSKEDFLESHIEDGTLNEENLEEFCDWLIDCDTGWRISDYGMKPLLKYAALLKDCDTADEKLIVCDAILNVTHQRSDLASWFVEGGSATLDQVASQ